jgi:hypothetical protein
MPIQSLVHKLQCENCGERGKASRLTSAKRWGLRWRHMSISSSSNPSTPAPSAATRRPSLRSFALQAFAVRLLSRAEVEPHPAISLPAQSSGGSRASDDLNTSNERFWIGRATSFHGRAAAKNGNQTQSARSNGMGDTHQLPARRLSDDDVRRLPEPYRTMILRSRVLIDRSRRPDPLFATRRECADRARQIAMAVVRNRISSGPSAIEFAESASRKRVAR